MLTSKLLTLSEAADIAKTERERGGTIVFTNGCFDLLHEGHTYILSRAKDLGSILIVGINSDESIRRLKGEGRPIWNLEKRIEELSKVSSIDYIVSFDEDTPYSVIKEITPDLIVKGGDYQTEGVVGHDIVKAVVIIPRLPNISTTRLIAKSRMQSCK